MRPKKLRMTGEGDLFRARIINLKHELVHLAQQDRLGLDRSRDCAALQRQGLSGGRSHAKSASVRQTISGVSALSCGAFFSFESSF